MSGLLHVQLGEVAQSEPAVQAVIDTLGAQLLNQFEQFKAARRDVEEEWLRDLRAYHGIYEADVLSALAQNPNRSKVFVHLTRAKTQGAYSRLVDLLFQGTDSHWGIEPTPLPDVPDDMRAEIIAEVAAERGVIPDEDEIPEIIDAVAKTRCERMRTRIEDQLEEGDYATHAKAAVLEGCIVGTGCLKGVTVQINQRQKWAREAGQWGVQTLQELKPGFSAVSVFDLYPDPYATSEDDATGIFQRHLLNRQQFADLKDSEGFDGEIIDLLLAQHASGNHREEPHETSLRHMVNMSATAGNSGRFEVLEYWGLVSGRDLIDAGVDVAEHADVQANVWVCGGRVLKAQINPLQPQALPYHFFRYSTVPHSFWGEGPPRQMRDSQTTINASTRAMLDNMAISSGPQVEVNMSIVAPDQVATANELYAWKVWKREGGDPSVPMLRFYDIPNQSTALLRVVDMFRRFADEETNLPSYTNGIEIEGANKTASGMSMQMGAAMVSIKTVVKNIDTMVSRFIGAMYHWNMQWAEDENVKGDYCVAARGSTALLAKEVQSERLTRFASMTANPIDAPLTDRQYLLRSIATSMDIDAEKAIPDASTIAAPHLGGIPGGLTPVGTPGMAGVGGVLGAPAGALPNQLGDGAGQQFAA